MKSRLFKFIWIHLFTLLTNKSYSSIMSNPSHPPCHVAPITSCISWQFWPLTDYKNHCVPYLVSTVNSIFTSVLSSHSFSHLHALQKCPRSFQLYYHSMTLLQNNHNMSCICHCCTNFLLNHVHPPVTAHLTVKNWSTQESDAEPGRSWCFRGGCKRSVIPARRKD